MANFIDVVTQSATIIDAYNTEALFAFQPERHFDRVAEVISPKYSLTGNGASAVFTIYSNIAVNTGVMNSTATTITPDKTITSSQKSITLDAYGDFLTLDTFELEAASFMDQLAVTATTLGFQAGQSIDLLSRSVFDGNTAAAYAANASGYSYGGTLADIHAEDVRSAFAHLDSSNIPKVDGLHYFAIAHPNVIATLRSEVGEGAWRTPMEYRSDSMLHVAGELGAWEGFRWISTANTWKNTAANPEYHTYFTGKDAIGRVVPKGLQIKSHGPYGPFNNLIVVNWSVFGGWGELRPEALYKIRSTAKYD